MPRKTAEQLLHEFRSNATADVTMSLLRSRDALLHLALMAAHLGDGQIVDGQTLTAEMDADLPVLLRDYICADDEESTLLAIPDADTLLTRWTKKGWVHHSVDPDRALPADLRRRPGGTTDAQPATTNLDRHRRQS